MRIFLIGIAMLGMIGCAGNEGMTYEQRRALMIMAGGLKSFGDSMQESSRTYYIPQPYQPPVIQQVPVGPLIQLPAPPIQYTHVGAF